MKRKTARKAARKRTTQARTDVRRAAFLAAFATCGNVTEAAAAAGCARADHYRWLTQADYAAAFEAAREEAVEVLEAEARRRAVHGVPEPVVYQGQFTYPQARDAETGELLWTDSGLPVLCEQPLVIHKKSDVLLMFLLKAARPDTYRENCRVELDASVNVVIERLQAARKRIKG